MSKCSEKEKHINKRSSGSLGLGLPAAMHSSTFVLLMLKNILASMGWTNKGISEVEYWRFLNEDHVILF